MTNLRRNYHQRTGSSGGPREHRGYRSMPVKLSGSLIALIGGLLISEMPASAVPGSPNSNTPSPIHGRSPSTKIGNGSSTSTNWSGYAVTGEVFTDVVGSWVQPSASCPSKQQQDAAFWVGIDGYFS